MLSEASAAWLNSVLMEAADGLRIGDGYVSVLTRGDVDQCRAQLQAWRDTLVRPLLSRELVEQAAESLSGVPRLAELAARYPNDADLGGVVRELLAAAPQLLRARGLLQEALSP